MCIRDSLCNVSEHIILGFGFRQKFGYHRLIAFNHVVNDRLEPLETSYHLSLIHIFAVANKLYGITLTKLEGIPVYHPDVEVFEVKAADLSLIHISGKSKRTAKAVKATKTTKTTAKATAKTSKTK